MDSQFHTTGSPVWIWKNDDQGWTKGTVQKVERDGKLQVRLDTGSIGSYKPENCPLRNVESRMGVEVQQIRSKAVAFLKYCRLSTSKLVEFENPYQKE